ncbi:MAG: hypothetical protein WCJ56_13365 [bacterium]
MTNDDAMVVVFDAESEVQALLFSGMLAEAGIDVYERLLEDDTFEGVRQDSLHSQLMVRPEDEARATDLIVSFTEESASGELDAGDEVQG